MQVPWIVSSDWVKLRGSHAIHRTSLSGAWGRLNPQHARILLQKVELLSTVCNNVSQSATTWFVARQVWLVDGKTRIIAVQLNLQQCRKTTSMFLSPVFPYLYFTSVTRKKVETRPHTDYILSWSADWNMCVQSLSHVHSYMLFCTSRKGPSRSMRSRLSPGMSNLEQSILLPSGELALGKCILFLLDAVCLGANWMGVTPSQGYPQLYVPGIRLYARVTTDSGEKTQGSCRVLKSWKSLDICPAIFQTWKKSRKWR